MSLKHIADIIEKGIKEHPGNKWTIQSLNLSDWLAHQYKFILELSVGMQTDGIEVASVGNTITLHESCLVEAFNLKAAIQFNFKNSKSNS